VYLIFINYSANDNKGTTMAGPPARFHHHHHRDAKRLAGASRRCDRSPERSVLR